MQQLVNFLPGGKMTVSSGDRCNRDDKFDAIDEALKRLETDVDHLKKTVLLGNGKDPLTSRMTEMETTIDQLKEISSSLNTNIKLLTDNVSRLQLQQGIRDDRDTQREKRSSRHNRYMMILLTTVLALAALVEIHTNLNAKKIDTTQQMMEQTQQQTQQMQQQMQQQAPIINAEKARKH